MTQTRPILLLMLTGCLAATGCTPRTMEEQCRSIMAPHEVADGPGGSVCVISGDSVAFEYSFGLREAGEPNPIIPASNFRLASMTKQFTAMCILMLRDKGALSLDQPLTDFFPHFASVGRSITVHQLLCHTSGVVAYEDVMPDTTSVPVLDEDVLRLVQHIDSTYFPPGSAYRYSNTGYALLALIVERTSGKRFADFLRDEIFTPVRMSGSVAFEKGISEVSERVYGHSPADSGTGAYVLTDQSMTSSVLGDGGIYSSVRDLARWHWALERPAFVRSETVREAMTVHATSADGSTQYGYGWRIEEMDRDTAYHHTGSTRGFRNAFFRVPSKRLAVIVLMNRDDAPAEAIARELLESVREKLGGEMLNDKR